MIHILAIYIFKGVRVFYSPESYIVLSVKYILLTYSKKLFDMIVLSDSKRMPNGWKFGSKQLCISEHLSSYEKF